MLEMLNWIFGILIFGLIYLVFISLLILAIIVQRFDKIDGYLEQLFQMNKDEDSR